MHFGRTASEACPPKMAVNNGSNVATAHPEHWVFHMMPHIDAFLQDPKTIHLIEIDSIASDSVYTHVTLNDEICHAKLDTGAQINVMTESLFKCIGKINKLSLFKIRC